MLALQGVGLTIYLGFWKLFVADQIVGDCLRQLYFAGCFWETGATSGQSGPANPPPPPKPVQGEWCVDWKRKSLYSSPTANFPLVGYILTIQIASTYL